MVQPRARHHPFPPRPISRRAIRPSANPESALAGVTSHTPASASTPSPKGMAMPTALLPESVTALHALLQVATDTEDPVIRAVAVRAGLLKLCRCGWYNPADFQRCEDCRARLIGEDFEPRTPHGFAAYGVLRYLHETHPDGEAPPDGEARFVAACLDGFCGEIAADIAHEVVTDAEHFGYRDRHTVLAWEVLAGIDARASDLTGAATVAGHGRREHE